MKYLAIPALLMGFSLLFNTPASQAHEFPEHEYELVALLNKSADGNKAQAAEIAEQLERIKDFMSRARFTPEGHQRYKEKVAGLEFLAKLLNASHSSTHPIDTISFNSKDLPKISGSGGCNRWMSSAEIEDHKIKIGPIAMTRKLCPKEGVMELERDFSKCLQNASNWRIEGNLLVLSTDKDSEMLLFERQDLKDTTKVP